MSSARPGPELLDEHGGGRSADAHATDERHLSAAIVETVMALRIGSRLLQTAADG